MALLTDYASTPNSSARVISPGPSYNAIGNVFSGAEEGLGALLKNGVQTQALTDRKAQNDSAQSVFDVQKAANDFIRSKPAEDANATFTGLTPSPAIPQDMKDSVQGILQAQVAYRQGKTPAGMIDLMVENAQSQLFNKYPNQKAVISDYFKASGIDHYMFDAISTQVKTDAMHDANKEAETNYLYDAGVKAGLVNPQVDSINDGAVKGQQWIQQQEQLKIAKAQQESVQASHTLNSSINEEALKKQQNDGYNAVMGGANLSIGHLIQSVLPAAASAQTPEQVEQLTKAVPSFKAAIESARVGAKNQALQLHLDDEHMKAIDGQFDEMQKGIDAATSGQIAASASTLKFMQDNLGIDQAHALRLYGAAVATYGQQGVVNSLFSADPTMGLGKDVLKKMGDEAKGWITSGGTSDSAAVIMNEMVQTIKGNKDIRDVSTQNAPAVMKGLTAAVRTNAAAIAAGATDSTSLSTFGSSYTNVLNAANMLTPNSITPDTLINATGLVAGHNQVASIHAMVADPGYHTQGVAIAQASGTTSAKLLEAAKSAPQQSALLPFESVVFDAPGARLQYSIKIDPKAYAKWNPLSNPVGYNENGEAIYSKGTGYIDKKSAQYYQSHPADDIKDTVTALNVNLHNIVDMSKYDENIPSQANLASRYRHFALGESLTNSSGQPIVSANEAYRQNLDKLRVEAEQLPGKIATTPGTGIGIPSNVPENIAQPLAQAASLHGIDPAKFAWTIGKESSFDPNADANKNDPKSHAYGLGQVQPLTATKLGYHPDDRKDIGKNLNMSATLLSQLLTKHSGDWIAALKDYGTLAGNNKQAKEWIDEFHARFGGQG